MHARLESFLLGVQLAFAFGLTLSSVEPNPLGTKIMVSELLMSS